MSIHVTIKKINIMIPAYRRRFDYDAILFRCARCTSFSPRGACLYVILKNLAASLPSKPKAIVIFSAHWEQPLQTISAVETNGTIYDFSGFQEELYQITYPAKGDRKLSETIQTLFASYGIDSVLDEQRGLDHGAWAVLKLIYPEADIPVVALSVNRYLSNEQQYQIGAALASLREQDVLIVGSGGTVHNLRQVNWRAQEADDWAEAFDQWIQEKMEACGYRGSVITRNQPLMHRLRYRPVNISFRCSLLWVLATCNAKLNFCIAVINMVILA